MLSAIAVLVGGGHQVCFSAEMVCATMNPSDQAKLVSYVQKKYKLEGSSLTLRELSRIDDSCYRRLLFTSEGSGRPLRIELYASPDFRFLTRDLLDSSVDPNEEARYQARIIQAALSQGGAPSLGANDAPVTLVLFSDFQCPFCSQMAVGLRRDILPTEGDGVRLVFRNFPLSMHPWAVIAAEAAACARAQNEKYFWPIHDYLFGHQRDLTTENLASKIADQALLVDGDFDRVRFNTCVDRKETASLISEDVALGQQLKITSTPTLFINGVRVSGYVPSQIRTIIREQVSTQTVASKSGQH